MYWYYAPYNYYAAWLNSWTKATLLVGVLVLLIVYVTVWQPNTDCYQLGLCHSKSLPSVSHFVGREEDIINITGYLDFATSDVQVVHIVGPPGFGKSTLAIKIGEIFLRKWVKVHYANLRMIKDVDSMSEAVMLSIFDSLNHKATYKRLEKWVRNQHLPTLVILDNCDEMFEHAREEFANVIKSLTLASYRRNVRFILTSQKWVTDIGNFRLHAIYNLSSEAAIELLAILAPGLMEDQKMEIADLTGNVPLALEVVGAIFNFPDSPTAEEVIDGLRKNLIAILSPDELHSKVDACIDLAYSYLTPEQKQSCVNLSHFPGSFDKESAVTIFDFNGNILDKLVQRSLLQYSRGRGRYYFHQLLQKFFLQVGSEEADEVLLKYFSAKFQRYFSQLLCESIISDSGTGFDVSRFYDEEHNIFRMFLLFNACRDVNITFHAIKVVSHESRMPELLRFLPSVITLFMLNALDSYTPNERASLESFLETHIQVLMLAAKSKEDASTAISMLLAKKQDIEEGYTQGRLSLKMFTRFYGTLAHYYEVNGEK